MLVVAHRALGATLFLMGAVASAHTHVAQGMALYDPQQHRAAAFRFGGEAGVVSYIIAARALWYLGYPDQGLTQSHEAVTLAQHVALPFALGYASNLVTVSFTYMRSEADCAWRVSYSAPQEWHSGAVPANARYVS